MARTAIIKRLVLGASVAAFVPTILSGCGSNSKAEGSAASPAKPSLDPPLSGA